MANNKELDLLLFHGTRQVFDRFDPAYFGTGEAGIRVGFYFTNNLKGAYHHATRYAPGHSEPLVYVCTLRTPALSLNRWKPIAQHSPAVQRHWDTLPAAQYWAKFRDDWFGSLFSTLPIGNPEPPPTDTDKCGFLRAHGFQVMDDFEGAWTDNYVCGPSIIVLDEQLLEIVEVLPAARLHAELIGHPKPYKLDDTLQPLGTTGVLSRLRPKS